jgi:hypothetical protein
VQIVDLCAPWKMSIGADNFVASDEILRGSCLPLIPRRDKRKSLLFINVLCKVSLMLALRNSLLNRE